MEDASLTETDNDVDVENCVRDVVYDLIRKVSTKVDELTTTTCGPGPSKDLLRLKQHLEEGDPTNVKDIHDRSSFFQAEVGRTDENSYFLAEPSMLLGNDAENSISIFGPEIECVADKVGSVLSVIVENRIAVPEVNSNLSSNPLNETENNPVKRRASGKAKLKTERKEPKNPTFWTVGDLQRNDVCCIICLGIYVKPVSLPCTHTVCLECYHQHVDVTSLYCPICRFRLSVWSRKATKENKLINIPFWERIKQQFPDDVANRLAGKDDEPFLTLTESEMKCRDGIMARKGEIKSEFDNGLEQFQQELQIERLKEEEASTELIQKLQEEEPSPPPPQSPAELQADFELAKRLQEEEERERQSAVTLRTSARFGASTSPGSQQSTSSKSSSASKPKASTSKKRGSPSQSSSSKAKKTKRRESLEGQRKISSFYTVTPSGPSSSSSSASNNSNVSVSNFNLNVETEGNLSSGLSVSETVAILPASSTTIPRRTTSPDAQSRVSDSDSDGSDNEPLVAGSRGIFPGLLIAENDELALDQDAVGNGDSQDTNESSSISLYDIWQREQLEKIKQRKLQEEADRKFALKLQVQLRKELEPPPDYSLRPKRDKKTPSKSKK